MPAITQDLYRNERYKHLEEAKDLEEREFDDHARRVKQVQEELAGQHTGGQKRRVFHAKMHACLLGTLTLRPDRPKEVRHGIFADAGPQHYNVLARFSNGVGVEAHDLKPDVRGLALKIFGVKDSTDTQIPPRVTCVDWLMTNSTNPFGKDQQEFVEFMEANVGPLSALGEYSKNHPEVFALLLKATARVIPSLATEQYWSGHPYLLGKNNAMKFNVAPNKSMSQLLGDALGLNESLNSLVQKAVHEAGEVTERLQHWFDVLADAEKTVDRNYLRTDLINRLKDGPLKYTLSVQLEKDANKTPIENTLVEWKEIDSPSIPVADLELTRESTNIDNEALRFSPRHFIPEHRPLGNLARGRLFTYKASQDGRGARSEEPDEATVFQL